MGPTEAPIHTGKRHSKRSGDHRRIAAMSVVLIAAAALAACSSSSTTATGSNSGTGASGNTASAPGITATTVKIGLLTSFTGPLASTFATVSLGFDARIDLQNAQGGVDGRKIEVVNADDQGSATQGLAAAQTLVEEDGVFAIGGLGTYQFASGQYLQKNNVPVVGYDIDGGPEWAPPYTNTIAPLGSTSPKSPAPVAWGAFLKSKGATSVASVGAAAPSAQIIAKNVQASATAAGLKDAYLNTTVPLSQTAGFDPIAQAIKASGADALTMSQGTAADLGLLSAIQQAGLHLKVILVLPPVAATSITSAQVTSEMQNTWSAWPMDPLLNPTAANKVITDALAKYGHSTAQPDQDELAAWAAADAIIKGLQLAGPNPTRATFLAKLKGLTGYDGGGVSLTPVNIGAAFGAGAQDTGAAPDACIAVSQFSGSKYGSSTTVCGGLVPNSNAAT
jgi:branched-chain amino acid transport system substrate-binding protein